MLTSSYIKPTDKRILTVVGHYGSGKTEFCVSLALKLAAEKLVPYARMAMIDLDIINPYFRSREQKELLRQSGIRLFGSALEGELTAEVPALAADVRAPLEDEACFTIVDVGGNDSGGKVLNQFKKYFRPAEYELFAVVNANRPETRDVTGAIEHITAIEAACGLTVTGLVNNCHLLHETTAANVAQGRALCDAITQQTGLPVVCDCYPEALLRREEVANLPGVGPWLLPLGLYMRKHYMDISF